MWRMTRDMWPLTNDTWNMTGDRWEEVNLLSKFQLPSSYGSGVRGDMWLLTCDTWHVTHDMWHLTMACVTWHTGGGEHCVNISGPSSYCFDVKGFWIYLNKRITHSWINYKGVCRTDPDTPGLLTRQGLLGHFWTMSKRIWDDISQIVNERLHCLPPGVDRKGRLDWAEDNWSNQ